MSLQMNTFFDIIDIILVRQFGYRAGYNCTTALFDILDDVVAACNEGIASVFVLLHYFQAFDMLNHQIFYFCCVKLGLKTHHRLYSHF